MTYLWAAALIASLFPPSVEYFGAFLLLVWLARKVKIFSTLGRAEFAKLPLKFRTFYRLGTIGTLIFLGTSFLSSLIAAYATSYQIPLIQVLKPYGDLFVKRCAVWLVLPLAASIATRRGWRLERSLSIYGVVLVGYLVYGFIQRYTGLDLVHGASARLPDHRLGYGVYRVSGFMGHPVSLSYSLMLISVTLMALLARFGGSWSGKKKRLWALILVLNFALLLISGSRWPLAIVLGVAASLLAPRLWHWRWWALAGTALLTVLAWIEGTALSRLGEIFQGEGSILDKIPRLIFWKIHWQMFRDQPLAGVGYASAEKAALDYYAANNLQSYFEKYSAHNIYLQTAADSGLIGIAGLVLFLGYFVFAAQRLGAAGTSVLWVLAAVCIGGLLQNNLRDSTSLFALWLCMAMIVAEGQSELTSTAAHSTTTSAGGQRSTYTSR